MRYAIAFNPSTLLLKRDGSQWYSGRMLTAPTLDYNEPSGITRLVTDTDWSSLAAGNNHFMALKKNGTLWSLGSNSNGQLGLGSLSNAAAMTQIGQANNWASMSGGANYSMGVKQDGTLWGWGDNSKGQYWGAPSAYQPVPAPITFK